MTFDYSIHLSDLLLVGGGILAFLKVFLSLRDLIRDLDRRVGTEVPRSGLTGDVRALQGESKQHREWFIRSGMDK